MSVEAESAAPPAVARGRLADYRELTKPRITLMVVLTALSGYVMASPERWDGLALAATLAGTALTCAGAGTINMLLEQRQDGLMARTRGRPIPSGRIPRTDAALFAAVLLVVGLALLLGLVNPVAAVLALLTVLSYTLVYTPLKLRMSAAILVGAFPGAFPPLIGWSGATGAIGAGGLAIFAILYLWQIPHFLAIDWLFREDYRRAGFRTVAVLDGSGGRTAWHAILSGCMLLVASAVPTYLGIAGRAYLAGALVAGVFYVGAAVLLARRRTNESARQLILASVAYLPFVLVLMILDRAA